MVDACKWEVKYQNLLAAVTNHFNQRADDRCRDDDDKLYHAAGLQGVDRRVGSKYEMMKSCLRFIDKRCEEGGWPTYAELEARIKELEECDVTTNRLLFERAERDNEQLRQQVIHHAERISKQSEIITKLVEGAKARETKIGELTELLQEVVDCDGDECRLDHDQNYCVMHDSCTPCLMWRIKQHLRDG